jgi:glycosyltransferase involved in cell wall biosynthesis
MKINYVHNAHVPSLAANAVQVARMCAAFEAAGAETRLVQPSGGGGSAEEIRAHYGLETGFATAHLPKLPLPASELVYGALAAALYGPRREGVLYTRAISVGAAAAFLGQPFVLEMHVSASAFRARKARRLARLIASPHFRAMIVISGKLKEDYERRYPALAGRVTVAHDGAEVATAAPPRPLEGAFKVGYVGQLYPGKGMEIIAELVPLCPWATFHVVGGAPGDVEAWRTRLSSHENVIFHGHVRHAETPGYLAAMDAVLAPYQRIVRGVGGGDQNLAEWMSPLKIFEYMSRGKAILASDLPVLREVLRDGENAVLCPPEDIAAWVAALRHLNDDENFRRRIGEQGEKDFLASYTWEQRARTILDAVSAGQPKRS